MPSPPPLPPTHTDRRLAALKHNLPCRSAQIEKLYNLFACEREPYAEAIYIHGGPSSGKSIVLRTVLEELEVKHSVINLLECYSTKILFETILNKLTGHKFDLEKPMPYAKCDHMTDFIRWLKRADEDDDLEDFVFVLDKAEELRSMDANLLRAFLRIRELTDLPITVIFVTDLCYEKFYGINDEKLVVQVYFPLYNKDELLEIMSLDYEYSKDLIEKNHEKTFEYDLQFFKNYINAFLSVFYRACRDLSELRRLARINFVKYCEPILKEECTTNDSMALWRKIAPKLKSSLDVLYLKIDSEDMLEPKPFSLEGVRSLELPFYAKYILIAAYLASYNSAKDDKRLFMKYHGKKKKTVKEMKNKLKVSERLNTQLGPKPFSLDRLLAIFYSLLDDKVGFNNNLLVQVSSLVELKLLSTVSDNFNLDGQKYKCNVTFDFIHNVSLLVGFNIKKYLSDFNM